MSNKIKLGIYVVSTLKHSYALKAQARALHSACVYAGVKNPVIAIVCSEDGFFEEVAEVYRGLFGKGDVFLLKRPEFFDCKSRKNYKNPVQLMIAQMRTLGTKKLLTEDCNRILSMDSDVIPKHNSIRCMLDTLHFDNGYYDVAQCPYPSQGGGSFLGGRGTKQQQILPDFYEEEQDIPKELKKKQKKQQKKLEQFIEDLAKNKTKKTEKIDKEIEEMRADIEATQKQIKACPPKANVFTLNGKKWRKRGWFDQAYPAIGLGSVVPVDWVGFGCTMMTKKAASLCDFSGYNGGGTEDLYIIWNRWDQYDIKIANISHSPSDHIVRDRNKEGKYIHIFTYHEKEGEHEGHLRQTSRPWYSQEAGEEFSEENNGMHSYPEEEKKTKNRAAKKSTKKNEK